MNVVSAVMSQTQILEQEVFLVEKLSPTPHEPMQHLKAVCFVRPVHENIAMLRQQMRNRIYGEYHIFFSNILRDAYLQVRVQDKPLAQSNPAANPETTQPGCRAAPGEG